VAYSLEQMREAAAVRGGECLATESARGVDRVFWRCPRGHTWETRAARVVHEGRWCPRCRNIKYETAAERSAAKNRQTLEYYHRNRDRLLPERRARHRGWALKYKYNLSEQEYDKRLAEQGGLCGLCHRPPGEDELFVVDHDHETEEVRGLIHRKCNLAIGFLEDRLDLLEAAVTYLKRFVRQADASAAA
jgi:hypothetical protein